MNDQKRKRGRPRLTAVAEETETETEAMGEAPPPQASRAPRVRKPPGATTFAGQLRELAAKHRTKLGSLVEAEERLAVQLAAVRAQREAAEGPLRQVEALLAAHPELPGLESDAPPTTDGTTPADPDAFALGPPELVEAAS